MKNLLLKTTCIVALGIYSVTPAKSAPQASQHPSLIEVEKPNIDNLPDLRPRAKTPNSKKLKHIPRIETAPLPKITTAEKKTWLHFIFTAYHSSGLRKYSPPKPRKNKHPQHFRNPW